MRTISDQRRTMLVAATILDRTRGMAGALVDRAERESGSRMRAYERVASTVGVSASWLRKFVRCYASAKEPGITAGMKIISQYNDLVRRIDAAAELEKTRAEALWGTIENEASDRLTEMVAQLDTTEAGGKDT